jgi:hypothetical protein
MSDRNRESDRILSVYKISVGFHRISIGIRYGPDRFLSVPIIGLNDLGHKEKMNFISFSIHHVILCEKEINVSFIHFFFALPRDFVKRKNHSTDSCIHRLFKSLFTHRILFYTSFKQWICHSYSKLLNKTKIKLLMTKICLSYTCVGIWILKTFVHWMIIMK